MRGGGRDGDRSIRSHAKRGGAGDGAPPWRYGRCQLCAGGPRITSVKRQRPGMTGAAARPPLAHRADCNQPAHGDRHTIDSWSDVASSPLPSASPPISPAAVFASYPASSAGGCGRTNPGASVPANNDCVPTRSVDRPTMDTITRRTIDTGCLAGRQGETHYLVQEVCTGFASLSAVKSARKPDGRDSPGEPGSDGTRARRPSSSTQMPLAARNPVAGAAMAIRRTPAEHEKMPPAGGGRRGAPAPPAVRWAERLRPPTGNGATHDPRRVGK